jgi:anti-sigma regulatory factor (Ser/Thr protein kinase)
VLRATDGKAFTVKATARTIELEPRPASAGQARKVVKRALRGVDPALRDVGVLLTSELVTNALLYARGSISLRIDETAEGYRISVGDGTASPVGPRQVGLEATSGRGLTLVDRLSGSWGVDVHEPDGKEVWFEVPRST